ncbi:hypothetical protein WICMUC_000204 [Wickerhamomyces mucosus]|uniref:ABC1 atypical kinase-like domain-containing protein n=1 Tax=Wickerhamomyces mucosus TaxID=1378264 RepID=A0A9P8PYS7_9ASCO|nr:hypothetical protein WICMUC_000204 [Wickerhamomyces mucosus]
MESRRQFTIEEEIIKLVELVRSPDFDSFKKKLAEYQSELTIPNDDPEFNLHLLYMDQLDPENSDLRRKLYEDFPLADNQISETIVNTLETIDIHLNRDCLIGSVTKLVEFLRDLKLFLNTSYINPSIFNFPSERETIATSTHVKPKTYIRQETVTGKRAKISIENQRSINSSHLIKHVLPSVMINDVTNINEINEISEINVIETQEIESLFYLIYTRFPLIYQNFPASNSRMESMFLNPKKFFGMTQFVNEHALYGVLTPFLNGLLNLMNIITSDEDQREKLMLNIQIFVNQFLLVSEMDDAYDAFKNLTKEKEWALENGLLYGPFEYIEIVKPDYLIQLSQNQQSIFPIEVKFLENLDEIFDEFTKYTKDNFQDLLGHNSNPLIHLLMNNKFIINCLEQSMYQLIGSNSSISFLTNGHTWVMIEDLVNYSINKAIPYSLSAEAERSDGSFGFLLPNFFKLTKFSVENQSFNSILMTTILKQMRRATSSIPAVGTTSSVKDLDNTKWALLRHGVLSKGSAEFTQLRYWVMMEVLKPYLVTGAQEMIQNSFKDLNLKDAHFRVVQRLSKKVNIKRHHNSSMNFLKEFITIRDSKIRVFNSGQLNIQEVIQCQAGSAIVVKNANSLLYPNSYECILKIFDPIRIATGLNYEFKDSFQNDSFNFSSALDFCLNVMLSGEISAYQYLQSKINLPKFNGVVCFIPTAFALKKLSGGIMPISMISQNLIGGLAIEVEYIEERFETPKTTKDLDEYFTSLIKNSKDNLLKTHKYFGLHQDIHSGNFIVREKQVYLIDFSFSLRTIKEDISNDFSSLREDMEQEFIDLQNVMVKKIKIGCDLIRDNGDESSVQESKFANESKIKQMVKDIIGEVYKDLKPEDMKLNSAGSDKTNDFDPETN